MLGRGLRYLSPPYGVVVEGTRRAESGLLDIIRVCAWILWWVGKDILFMEGIESAPSGLMRKLLARRFKVLMQEARAKSTNTGHTPSCLDFISCHNASIY